MRVYPLSEQPAATRGVLAGAFLTLIAALLGCGTTAATALQIQVVDRTGAPVRDVVVAVSDGAASTASTTPNANRAVMDQLKLRFVPDVLIVRVGTSVSFPNSDTVSHQVYSFSSAKPFQLPLYKGTSYPPITFDKPGLIVLGCNIHDGMVGYIYVTNAHWYGQTDAEGKLSWPDVLPGPVMVTIWSPYIADSPNSLSRSIELSDVDHSSLKRSGDKQVVEFKLAKPLRSSPEPRPRRADWDY